MQSIRVPLRWGMLRPSVHRTGPQLCHKLAKRTASSGLQPENLPAADPRTGPGNRQKWSGFLNKGIGKDFQKLLSHGDISKADLLFQAFRPRLERDDWSGAIKELLQPDHGTPAEPGLGLRYLQQAVVEGKHKLSDFHGALLYHNHKNDTRAWLATLQQMQDLKLSMTKATFSILLEFCIKQDDKALGLQYFLMMETYNLVPDQEMFTLLLKLLSRSGELEEFREYCGQMATYGLEPRKGVFLSAMDSFAKRGKMDATIQVFEDMGSHGFDPDKHSLGTLIAAFCVEPDMERIAVLMQEVRSRMTPTSAMYLNILSACATLPASSPLLMKYFGDLFTDGVEPNRDIFNVLIKAYATQGNLTAAHVYLDCLKARPNCKADIHSYSPILNALLASATKDKIRLMEDKFEEIIKQGIVPVEKTFITMALAFAYTSYKVGAKKYLTLMAASGHTRRGFEVYRVLTILAARKGDIVSMKKYYDQVIFFLRPNPDRYSIAAKSDVFGHVIRAYTNEQQSSSFKPHATPTRSYAEKLKFFNALQAQMVTLSPTGYAPMVYDEFIRTFALLNAVHEMLAHLRGLDHAWPNQLRSLLRPQSLHQARDCLEVAKATTEIPRGEHLREIYRQLYSPDLENKAYPYTGQSTLEQ